MSESSLRRASVGFKGGQSLSVKVTDAELVKLHAALGTTGWHELKTDDGPIRLDLGQLVYVSSESDDQRVGFGT